MDNAMDLTISGIVNEIIFENEDNGYKICVIICPDGQEYTARGILPFVFVGETITVTGHVETHDFYGDQLIVSSFEKIKPKSVSDIETFLASGYIKNVGPATAKLIVSKFGEDTPSVILNSPEQLASIKGISLKKANEISEYFREYETMSEIIVFFNKYGINSALALKVYDLYGPLAIQNIQNNPYKLIDEVPEIGFKTADSIGSAIGIDAHFPSRIRSGIISVLQNDIVNGNTFTIYSELIQSAADYLGVEQELIATEINNLVQFGRIVRVTDEECDHVFLEYMYTYESITARKLLKMSKNSFTIFNSKILKYLTDFEGSAGIKLGDKQIEAITKSVNSGVSIITGGPGTGKTTIIRAIVHILSSQKRKCVLTAPTGRAAKRMSEACIFPAKTIHRLLEYEPLSEIDDKSTVITEKSKVKFNRNHENPLECNVVIVDEASMVDSILMYRLLDAITDEMQLIIVGDKDQLPPVGPGNVLKDLIRSGAFNTTILDYIYRQEEESLIAYNAHNINVGELPKLNVMESDFFFLKRSGTQNVLDTLIDVVANRLPQKYGINPINDIQVIIPNKKGTTGTQNVNLELQKALNPYRKGVDYIKSGATTFRVGDRVMQIKNNYDIKWTVPSLVGVSGSGIFNGEMGIIMSIDTKKRELLIEFDEERTAVYNFGLLSDLELCYAITVHKSQGSEFPYCVIPVCDAPSMLLTRNILYTAVTRARKMVVMIGDTDILAQMINNNYEQRRLTYLYELILNNKEEK